MKKAYITPEIIVVATADLCSSENPFNNSVMHGGAKDFGFEEEDEDFTTGLSWDLWDSTDGWDNG